MKSLKLSTGLRPLSFAMILAGIVASLGISVGQQPPETTLADLAKIPASKFTQFKPVENGSSGQD